MDFITKPLAAVALTHTHSRYTRIAIHRHVTSHVALTLVCWLLYGVFLYERLEDEVGEC